MDKGQSGEVGDPINTTTASPMSAEINTKRICEPVVGNIAENVSENTGSADNPNTTETITENPTNSVLDASGSKINEIETAPSEDSSGNIKASADNPIENSKTVENSTEKSSLINDLASGSSDNASNNASLHALGDTTKATEEEKVHNDSAVDSEEERNEHHEMHEYHRLGFKEIRCRSHLFPKGDKKTDGDSESESLESFDMFDSSDSSDSSESGREFYRGVKEYYKANKLSEKSGKGEGGSKSRKNRRRESTDDEYDPSAEIRIFKVVFIGDSNVGKTSIVQRIARRVFQESYVPTIGLDFSMRVMDAKDGSYARLLLFDLAGEEKQSQITSCYYRRSHGAVIVYDSSNLSGFDNVLSWAEDIRDATYADFEDSIPILLLGNKCDILSLEEYKTKLKTKFAKENGFLATFHTSAKYDVGIEDAMECLVKKMVENAKKEEKRVQENTRITLGEEDKTKPYCIQDKSCCY